MDNGLALQSLDLRSFRCELLAQLLLKLRHNLLQLLWHMRQDVAEVEIDHDFILHWSRSAPWNRDSLVLDEGMSMLNLGFAGFAEVEVPADCAVVANTHDWVNAASVTGEARVDRLGLSELFANDVADVLNLIS
mmetsp:Transcript_43856/g.66146  ORF Transcript_43856/g.66146 Transcript_43856/m.66146 type:complete len:134 (-) Transcript_43856:718-1119(-)